MSQLVNSTYLTLDGVIEEPQTWPDLGGFGEEGIRIQTDLVQACSAIVMGRRTYEIFAEAWPAMAGNPLADKMNATPKYVASQTLTDPDWSNTQVIAGDPVAAVERLKQESEGDIVQFGFGEVAHALMAAGLLDRLRLWVHPFVLGRGGPDDLLFRQAPLTRFELAEHSTLESGIVVLDYVLRRDA